MKRTRGEEGGQESESSPERNCPSRGRQLITMSNPHLVEQLSEEREGLNRPNWKMTITEGVFT